MSTLEVLRARTRTSVIRHVRMKFLGLFRHIRNDYEERRAIAELRSLDDRMLRDLGLSRSEIRAAVRGEIYRR